MQAGTFKRGSYLCNVIAGHIRQSNIFCNHRPNFPYTMCRMAFGAVIRWSPKLGVSEGSNRPNHGVYL